MNTSPRRSPGFLAVRAATHPLREWWMDVTIEGREQVPSFGGAIIAANHLSFVDSLLLMYGIGRPVSFLGKVEYLDSFTTRHLFPAVGMIPVDRLGTRIAGALREARARLDDGALVGIFPEGTRSRDGLLHDGHSGVAHLALKTGAPIVPVGIVGTDVALPIGARAPQRTPVVIRVGAPINPNTHRGVRATMTQRHTLTAEVMDAIAALSGQRRANLSPAANPAGVRSAPAVMAQTHPC